MRFLLKILELASYSVLWLATMVMIGVIIGIPIAVATYIVRAVAQ